MLQTFSVENFILTSRGRMHLWRGVKRCPVILDKDGSRMRGPGHQLAVRSLSVDFVQKNPTLEENA